MKTKHWKLFDLPDTTSLKTDLFTKTHQLHQLVDELEQIMIMPAPQRHQWANENQDQINDFMDQLAEESSMALSGLDGDEIEMKLSMEYVSELRLVTDLVRSILFDRKRLKS
jgi:hypothetical protein